MKDNNDLIKDITEHLDQSLETLDPEILSQIRAARYNALEKKQPGFMHWAFPVGGIAVAALALFVTINLFTGPENNQNPELANNDVETVIEKSEPDKENTLPVKDIESEIEPDQIELVEILSSEEQTDFFENLEFYAWLAENENISG
jgi:hypothetical protein